MKLDNIIHKIRIFYPVISILLQSHVVIWFKFSGLSTRSSIRSSIKSPQSLSSCGTRKAGFISEMDSISIMGAEREQVLGEKMRSIVTSFRTRVTNVKTRLEEPPSPDDNILRYIMF